ncbi:MAG: hypothetical protein NXI09_00590 [Bacteroidetes bacterium]|nr:hypothetical protein [Bacteroidota bacterium]
MKSPSASLLLFLLLLFFAPLAKGQVQAFKMDTLGLKLYDYQNQEVAAPHGGRNLRLLLFNEYSCTACLNSDTSDHRTSIFLTKASPSPIKNRRLALHIKIHYGLPLYFCQEDSIVLTEQQSFNFRKDIGPVIIELQLLRAME